jgi:hypothetical protein
MDWNWTLIIGIITAIAALLTTLATQLRGLFLK